MRISNHNPYLYIEQCTRFTSLPAICKQLKFVVDVCWPFFPIFCLSYVMPPKVTLSYKLKLEIERNKAALEALPEEVDNYEEERLLADSEDEADEIDDVDPDDDMDLD